MNSQLLEVTNKVLMNRKWEAQKKADKQMKKKVFLLAASLGNPGPMQQAAAPSQKGETKRGPPLYHDQCA